MLGIRRFSLWCSILVALMAGMAGGYLADTAEVQARISLAGLQAQIAALQDQVADLEDKSDFISVDGDDVHFDLGSLSVEAAREIDIRAALNMNLYSGLNMKIDSVLDLDLEGAHVDIEGASIMNLKAGIIHLN